jgi:hypothetical protein
MKVGAVFSVAASLYRRKPVESLHGEVEAEPGIEGTSAEERLGAPPEFPGAGWIFLRIRGKP